MKTTSWFLPFFFISLLFPVTTRAESKRPQPAPTPLEYVLQDIHGTVYIRENGSSRSEKAEEEETVESGDEVITGVGSKASLTLNRNTMFNLSENSDVKIDRLTAKRSTHGFLSRLGLLKGKILCEVEKLKASRSTFEIASGGVICGVRGTSFEVENDAQQVQTSTYQGEVEVQKGDQSATVEANQHQDFAFDENTFLPKRALSQQERDNYHQWQTQKAVVERKLLERQAVLDSMANLSEDERAELLDKLDKIKTRDRLKEMRRILQDKYKFKRQNTLNKIQSDAARERKKNNHLRQKPSTSVP